MSSPIDPNFLLAQLAATLKNKPYQPYHPMWEEDQANGITPGFKNDYDYYNALKYGVRRQGFMGGHMYSRVPQTGLELKSPTHPTFWMALQANEAMGYETYLGKDGRLYSRKKAAKK